MNQVGKDDLSWGWCTHGGALWHAGQKEHNVHNAHGHHRVYAIPEASLLCDLNELDLPLQEQLKIRSQRSAIKSGDLYVFLSCVCFCTILILLNVYYIYIFFCVQLKEM